MRHRCRLRETGWAKYSVISFVISKWLLPELSIPAAGQKNRRLWGRECAVSFLKTLLYLQCICSNELDACAFQNIGPQTEIWTTKIWTIWTQRFEWQVDLGPVHTHPFSNENGAVLLRIRLSSTLLTLQRRKWSPKTQPFENAHQSGAIWKQCFLKTLFFRPCPHQFVFKRKRSFFASLNREYPKWRTDATMWLQFCANFAGRNAISFPEAVILLVRRRGSRPLASRPLARSNTGSPGFTDFPSLRACPESSLTNLIGSDLNLLCLQSHSNRNVVGPGQGSRFPVHDKRDPLGRVCSVCGPIFWSESWPRAKLHLNWRNLKI